MTHGIVSLRRIGLMLAIALYLAAVIGYGLVQAWVWVAQPSRGDGLNSLLVILLVPVPALLVPAVLIGFLRAWMLAKRAATTTGDAGRFRANARTSLWLGVASTAVLAVVWLLSIFWWGSGLGHGDYWNAGPPATLVVIWGGALVAYSVASWFLLRLASAAATIPVGSTPSTR